ncbi:MAG: hypothetical protein R2932_58050 [Caldilineaceae bacterium]
MSSGTLASPRTQTRTTGRTIGWLFLGLLTVVAMAAVMWFSLIYAKPATNLAGTEQVAQRIFYIHMVQSWARSLPLSWH